MAKDSVNPQILLIDDDDLVAKTLKKLLAARGYPIETAHSAVEAISKASVSEAR